ncbi:MAG: POTRA domain-containing protein, partial [Cyanobacteria bacterium P01_D01_bin.71]
MGIASQARGETLATTTSKAANAPAVSVAELVRTADNPPAEVASETVLRSDTVATLEPFATLEPESTIDDATPSAEVDPESLETDSRLTSKPSDREAAFVGVYHLNQLPSENEAAVAEVIESQEIAQTDEATPDEATPDPEAEADEADEADPDAAEEAEEDAGATEIENDDETQVLVAEVAVASSEGEAIDPALEDTVYDAINTQPGRTTTRSQIQADINSVFATGFFANVRAVPTDTPLGVRVTFVVDPNPVLTQVEIEGDEVLPDEVVDDIFSPQYGQILNLLDLQDGILELNNWYQDNGFVLAQVIAAPEVAEDGVVTLQVAEGVIEDITVQFMTEDGLVQDEEGNPIDGKTHDYIILREFETQAGDVFQQNQIQSDLQAVFGLGIFDDVTLTLNPGQKDPRQVDVTVNVIERNTGSVAAGVGFNFTGDLFGTLSYRQDNFGGNNQKFSAEAQLSFRDILFDVSFTDPWIGGDPYRTSYT